MKAIDAIRMALQFGDRGMKTLEDMAADPFVQPGLWGGNHAMWIAGHITVIEGRLHKVLRGLIKRAGILILSCVDNNSIGDSAL